MRWRKGVGRLVQRIAGSGMMEDADLDVLARTFVTAGDHVYWEVPESWFSAESIVITIAGESDNVDDTDEAPDEKGTVVARRVHPPLRRWAVAHLVARDPTTWHALFTNAGERSGTDGAAMMAGLFDGFDHLPDAARRAIISKGLDWPRGNVRRMALERFADLGHRQLAHDIAVLDANAQVRKWAPALLEPEPTPPAPDAAVDPNAEITPNSEQESLF
jgi:hypothetical protein